MKLETPECHYNGSLVRVGYTIQAAKLSATTLAEDAAGVSDIFICQNRDLSPGIARLVCKQCVVIPPQF